ncbi:putative repeat protein (TIGR01451 family), partial [Arthrobacter sp. 1088]|uniref:DUF7927 domain-containing protein n=1 Tax=Arthrobacter sp. 1088 TaxID=2817768 RepID=UPI0028679339
MLGIQPGRHRSWTSPGGTPLGKLGASGTIAASLVMALLLGIVFMANAVPAFAAPVYQITARWVDQPAQIAPGEVVTSEWRVNVNDDAAAPSNAPVDNVTFTVTATNGKIASIPDICLTTGVTPVSSISADGRTLTCNLGTQNMGTAAVVQVPVVADGINGSKLSLTGETNGQAANVAPIPIVGTFGMDTTWTGPSNTGTTSSNGDGTYNVNLPIQWTVNLLKGSVAGPNSVTYTLDLSSTQGTIDSVSCGKFGGSGASAHPFTVGAVGATPDNSAPWVGGCTVAPVAGKPGKYTMTITGIDYSRTQIPRVDSGGKPLPTDRDAVATGQITVHVSNYSAAGSVALQASAPTYQSVDPTLTGTDDAANNSATKTFSAPGGWASTLVRSYTGSGGTNWDDTYRLSPGQEYQSDNNSGIQAAPGIAGTNKVIKQCTVVDYAYATTSKLPQVIANGSQFGNPDYVVRYYVGNSALLTSAPGSGYDPEAFVKDCDQDPSGWTTTPPADLRTVKAFRLEHNASVSGNVANVFLETFATIRAGVTPGQDIWKFSSFKQGSNPWTYRPADVITPVSGARYPATNAFRDLLRTVSARPILSKSADRSVARVGGQVTYTLNYQALGGAGSPPRVDDFVIEDTLPLGMSYVPGSASPEPVVTTDVNGQDTLTWTLDGVPTSQRLSLTYTVDIDASVSPGGQLTNTATATFDGQTTRPTTATVTTASNGTTTIGKTADEAFIPNVNGDGSGAGSWTVTLKSQDPTSQSFTDTIDILPYNGDGRGTSYSGSYALTGVTAVAGSTVYYTSADPATLNDDPADASNGASGNIAGNTVGWTTTKPANPTAVRVIGPALAPGATQAFKVSIQTTGAKGGDILVNRAQARAQHTELVMRTSAPISVANYYSASLKKYVQDKAGVWHDANTVEDYPTYRPGDQVPYRIVLTNTGQGTLTNVVVTDDKFPAEGGFTIASLAPGASQTHEFTAALGTNIGSTFVNTASATADTPADSQVPPTINTDPAGVQVTNYTTVKSSDPASGSTVVPGQKVTYTVTVKQTGSAPADASFTDDLTKVLDDADYNGDAVASVGTVNVAGTGLSWNGTVPVGGTATITYSVTVKSPPTGDQVLTNVVTSDGCVQSSECTTTHITGGYTVSKTADPVPGSTVIPGQKVSYTVHVKQTGAGALTGVIATDDLSKVLDDAAFNNDAVASAGTATFDAAAKTLVWNGDLPVGADVTITYSVTVAPLGTGDGQLSNVITPTSPGGVCDTAVGCTTNHVEGGYTVSKTADPVPGSTVIPGQKVSYTVHVKQT